VVNLVLLALRLPAPASPLSPLDLELSRAVLPRWGPGGTKSSCPGNVLMPGPGDAALDGALDPGRELDGVAPCLVVRLLLPRARSYSEPPSRNTTGSVKRMLAWVVGGAITTELAWISSQVLGAVDGLGGSRPEAQDGSGEVGMGNLGYRYRSFRRASSGLGWV
jgi:hypothetical protein